MHWLEMKWKKMSHASYNFQWFTTRAWKLMTTEKRSDNFPFKIFSPLYVCYICYVILTSGRKKAANEVNIFFLSRFTHSIIRNDMKRNETERNEPCFMIKVMTCFEHTSFFVLCCCRCCCFCCLILFSWRISFCVFRLIQFGALAAIVVGGVQVSERNCVAISLSGVSLFFLSIFIARTFVICHTDMALLLFGVNGKCFYCCTDFSLSLYVPLIPISMKNT